MRIFYLLFVSVFSFFNLYAGEEVLYYTLDSRVNMGNLLWCSTYKATPDRKNVLFSSPRLVISNFVSNITVIRTQMTFYRHNNNKDLINDHVWFIPEDSGSNSSVPYFCHAILADKVHSTNFPPIERFINNCKIDNILPPSHNNDNTLTPPNDNILPPPPNNDNTLTPPNDNNTTSSYFTRRNIILCSIGSAVILIGIGGTCYFIYKKYKTSKNSPDSKKISFTKKRFCLPFLDKIKDSCLSHFKSYRRNSKAK